MPYIKQEDRKLIKNDKFQIDYDNIETAGELQYAMAVIFENYVKRKKLSYQTLNDIMGALSGADKEFYRMVVVPYEESKIKSNGGVY